MTAPRRYWRVRTMVEGQSCAQFGVKEIFYLRPEFFSNSLQDDSRAAGAYSDSQSRHIRPLLQSGMTQSSTMYPQYEHRRRGAGEQSRCSEPAVRSASGIGCSFDPMIIRQVADRERSALAGVADTTPAASLFYRRFFGTPPGPRRPADREIASSAISASRVISMSPHSRRWIVR